MAAPFPICKDRKPLKKLLRDLLKALLFLLVGGIILWLVYRQQDQAWQAQCALDGIPKEDCSLLKKIASDFASADFRYLFLMLLAFAVSNLSRAARWLMLLRPLGYSPRPVNAFLTIMLGYFANLGLPRIGEIVRAGTFSRYENIPVEKTLGTVVVDRIVDVLSLAVVIALAFLFEFDTISRFLTPYLGGSESEGSTPLLRYLFIALLIGGGLFWLFRKPLLRSRPGQKIMGMMKGFGEGLQSIRRVRSPFWFILHSLNIWLMYYLMTWLGFLAFEPTSQLGFSPALIVFVAGSLGMVIPSPGGLGSYHLLITAALTGLYAINGPDAFSFANIIFFTIQIGANILLGLLALALLPVINGGKV